MSERLFVKVMRETLPQVRDKYPFIYLERGRLEIDDSSIKWIDAERHIVPLPAAMLNAILLGPGTSVTNDAICTAAAANCSIAWVSEDGLLFYAVGIEPTSDTRNFRRQMGIASNRSKALVVARRMFSHRFPDDDVSSASLKTLMGMEGHRVRAVYQEKAQEYRVGWKGRKFSPGKFDLSDTTNKVLTAANGALYGIIASALHSMGYSPHIGFVHSGSPLPFVYDLADLYKEHLCIDLAFYLTRDMAGRYDKHKVSTYFRERVIEFDLLDRLSRDIPGLFEGL